MMAKRDAFREIQRITKKVNEQTEEHKILKEKLDESQYREFIAIVKDNFCCKSTKFVNETPD